MRHDAKMIFSLFSFKDLAPREKTEHVGVFSLMCQCLGVFVFVQFALIKRVREFMTDVGTLL